MIQTLENLLSEGVTIYGTTSVKMIDGELVMIKQKSKYEFPLEFIWDGSPVSVVWDAEHNELVVLDNSHGELAEAGSFETLRN